jgi:hypothetical protein
MKPHFPFSLAKPAALLVALVLLLSTAVPAFAASDPTASQYNTDPQQAASGARSVTADPATGLDKPVGGLPVTGLDIIALALVALALVGTGVALKSLTPARSD